MNETASTNTSSKNALMRILAQDEMRFTIGGVAPVYDDKGHIIRTCTEPLLRNPFTLPVVSFPKF